MMMTTTTTTMPWRRGNGTTNVGGTTSHTFVGDGTTLCFHRHPEWVFRSFARTEHPWQTYWPVHPPYPSSSITRANIAT
jgi:hypothetical protein